MHTAKPGCVKLKEAVEFYFEISGWVSDENKLHFDEMMTMSALH